MGRAPIHERAWTVYERMLVNGLAPAAAATFIRQRFGFVPTRPIVSPLPATERMFGLLPQIERVYADVIV